MLTVGAILACIAGPIDPWNVLAKAQRPSFRAGVDLVSLSVTVTDPTQRYVANLNLDDFIVLEDGVPQKLTFFGKTGLPLALALLLDTSASMEQALATAQEAAIGFARQLGPSDMGTVIDFDSRVVVLHDFTSDATLLEKAIQGTSAGGSTALYNAVYIGLRELNKVKLQGETPDGPRRRAIVVLSDGEDTSSLVSFEDVLDLASRSDTVIFAIGLGTPESLGTRSNRDAQFVLRRLAEQTGGRAFFPREAKDLADVYHVIRDELSSQYSLAYESSRTQRDGQFRRIMVRVSRPGVTVRTRQGYYAPSK
jgi:VWFA-related protein